MAKKKSFVCRGACGKTYRYKEFTELMGELNLCPQCYTKKINEKPSSDFKELKRQGDYTTWWSEEDKGFITTNSILPYIVAFGETPEESMKEYMVAMELVADDMKEDGE